MTDSDELRQRTRELALTIGRSSFAIQTSSRLVEHARRWDQERRSTPPETRYRRALAQTLLDTYDELDSRIRALGAPDLSDRRGPLCLWADNPNSPLVGVLLDIDPFQNYDIWSSEALVPEPAEARPRPARRRRPRPVRNGGNDTRNPVAPAAQRRPPGPTGVGWELGRQNRSRPGELVPGFMGELMDDLPDGTRQVGVPLVGLVLRFVAPLTGFALGALNTAITLADTLDSANRTIIRENRAIGVRLGLAATGYLSAEQLGSGNVRETALMTIILNRQNLSRIRNQQIRFAGASGPAMAERAIKEGVSAAARTANQVIARVEPGIEAELGEVTSSQRAEIRRQILDALVDETAEGLRSTSQ